MFDLFRRLKNLFNRESVTIEEYNQLKLYEKLNLEYLELQKDYDDLTTEYNILKKVVFSPLHVPNDQSSANIFIYVIIGITAINLLVSFFK